MINWMLNEWMSIECWTNDCSSNNDDDDDHHIIIIIIIIILIIIIIKIMIHKSSMSAFRLSSLRVINVYYCGKSEITKNFHFVLTV